MGYFHGSHFHTLLISVIMFDIKEIVFHCKWFIYCYKFTSLRLYKHFHLCMILNVAFSYKESEGWGKYLLATRVLLLYKLLHYFIVV